MLSLRFIKSFQAPYLFFLFSDSLSRETLAVLCSKQLPQHIFTANTTHPCQVEPGVPGLEVEVSQAEGLSGHFDESIFAKLKPIKI